MSNDIAISIEGLGKRYQLGQTIDLTRTFRETLQTLPRFFARKATRTARKIAVGAASGQVSAKKTPMSTFTPDPRVQGDKFWALRDFNLQVKQGEIVGIIGRNGAGKSTLLKILSRITAPTTGRIKLHGRIGALLEVGTGFHPELTGRENIFLNGAILGMRKQEIKRKFEEIVDFAAIGNHLDTPVKRYSSGMGVRLGFAIAAHLEPEILIVDEVLAVGDAAFQKKCLGKMNSVAEQGRTILFVSHNMQAIKQLCTRAICLDYGTLSEDGTASDVVENYLKNELTAERVEEIGSALEKMAPDPALRITNVRIMQDGMLTNHVITGKSVQISIEYEVLQPTYGLRVYIILFDFERTPLFRSFSHSEENELRTLQAGKYISEVTIPADYLAPVTYHVGVSASIWNIRHCFQDELLITLHVGEPGRIQFAYACNGPIGFKLAPLLSWKTDFVPHAHTD